MGTNKYREVRINRTEAHSLPVRVFHWINALAIILLLLSGWRIYNGSPLFDFSFPHWLTLGDWLINALQWHFAMMWLLVINHFIYLCFGILGGHFRHKFLPIQKSQLGRDIKRAFTCKLRHTPDAYNSLQKILYCCAVVFIVVLIASGLAIWKPVQLQQLVMLMGDYEGARLVHFYAMCLLLGFIIVHATMVALVPKALTSMITGQSTTKIYFPRKRNINIPSTEAGDAL